MIRAAPPPAGDPTATAPESGPLSRFRLGSPAGGTAESRVYAAIEIGSGAPVAIKFGRARRTPEGRLESDADVLANLRHEADMLRRLDGIGAPRLREFHEQPPCLVLDWIEGIDLERLLLTQGRRFSGGDIVVLCERLAEIVTAIHARGFLHGDIKPSNIVVGEEGAPALIDFGAARGLIAADDREDRSATPGYAPPELHRADRPIGPWSDVYALGAVAYRMATDRAPIPAEARLGGAVMIAAIEAAGPGIPGALAAAIDWALELEPAARPFSAEEWRQAIRLRNDREADPGTVKIRRRFGAEVVPSGRSPGAAASRRRWRAALIAAAVVAVAALAAIPWAGPRLVALYQSHFKHEWLVDAGGRGDVATISAALSRAPDGATIRIGPGRYAETLTIGRPVALIGMTTSGGQPVVVAANGACATVTAASALISQISLRAESGPGRRGAACVEIAGGQTTMDRVRVSAADGAAVAVRNGAELHLVDASVGGGEIVVTGGARATLSGGEVRDSPRSGIVVRGAGELHISGTHIGGTREAGLLLAEGATARIEKATIGDSGTSALEIASGASGTIADSMIAGAAQAGVFLFDGGKAVVERTQVTGSGLSGLIVAATAQAKVDGSTFEQNHEHGVLVLDGANGSVTNSRIVGNAGHGIAIERGAVVELTDNVAERNREPQIFDSRRPESNGDRRRGGAS